MEIVPKYLVLGYWHCLVACTISYLAEQNNQAHRHCPTCLASFDGGKWKACQPLWRHSDRRTS